MIAARQYPKLGQRGEKRLEVGRLMEHILPVVVATIDHVVRIAGNVVSELSTFLPLASAISATILEHLSAPTTATTIPSGLA